MFPKSRLKHVHSVELVYIDHSRDQVVVVVMDKWSLCKDVTVFMEWFKDQPVVVTTDKWSLIEVSLYVRQESILHLLKLHSL
jgi:hypothetical protein